jgi:hypothetical protein
MKIPWLWIVFLGLVALLVWSVYATWGVPGLIGLPAGLLVLVGLGKLLGGWLVQRAFMIPFAAKGKVLRGAKVEVHSVTPCEQPARAIMHDAEGTELPTKDLSWHWIEATITPRPSAGPFHFWEAGELLLVPEKTRPGMPSGDAEEWGINSLQIWDAGQQRWLEDEGFKYPGPQKLRIQVGVPTIVRRVRVRYYFEIFGEIQLPPSA